MSPKRSNCSAGWNTQQSGSSSRDQTLGQKRGDATHLSRFHAAVRTAVLWNKHTVRGGVRGGNAHTPAWRAESLPQLRRRHFPPANKEVDC